MGNVKDFELEAAQKKVEELQRALDQICLEKEELSKKGVSLEKYQLLVREIETLTNDNGEVKTSSRHYVILLYLMFILVIRSTKN